MIQTFSLYQVFYQSDVWPNLIIEYIKYCFHQRIKSKNIKVITPLQCQHACQAFDGTKKTLRKQMCLWCHWCLGTRQSIIRLLVGSGFDPSQALFQLVSQTRVPCLQPAKCIKMSSGLDSIAASLSEDDWLGWQMMHAWQDLKAFIDAEEMCLVNPASVRSHLGQRTRGRGAGVDSAV